MSFRLPTFTDETNLVPSLRRLVSDLEGTLGEQGDRLEALENTSTAPGTGSPLEIQQETSVVDSDVSVMNFTSGGDVDLDVSYSGGVATINVSVNSAAGGSVAHLQTELDGTSLNTQTSVINFKGNLDVYSSAGVINVSIPPASNTVQTEVEGSVISSDTSVINFRGNVDVYTSAGVVNVSIPSGGGSALDLELRNRSTLIESQTSIIAFFGGGTANVVVSETAGVVNVSVSGGGLTDFVFNGPDDEVFSEIVGLQIEGPVDTSIVAGIGGDFALLTFPAAGTIQTEVEGSVISSDTSVINFRGNVDVYTSSGVVNVSIPSGGGGGSSLEIQQEASVVDSDVSVINFRGNVDVYTSAGVINVSIPSGGGGGGGSPLEIQQATSVVDSDVSVMNFTGGGDADVDVSQAGGVVTVNVSVNSGAGGSTPIRVHAILASVDFANNVTGAGALHPCRCSNVLVNDSTAWDTSVFTAPTTGLYQFNVYYAVQGNDSSSDWARIHFNCSADTTKSIQGPLNVRTNSDSQRGHYSTAIYLSVGQSISPYIQVFGGGGNNGDITAGQLGQATFSAFLVN